VALCQARISTKPLWGFPQVILIIPSHVPNSRGFFPFLRVLAKKIQEFRNFFYGVVSYFVHIWWSLSCKSRLQFFNILILSFLNFYFGVSLEVNHFWTKRISPYMHQSIYRYTTSFKIQTCLQVSTYLSADVSMFTRRL